MKHLVALLLFILPAFGFARIGETEQQCSVRYGRPTGTGSDPATGLDMNTYKKNGFEMYCYFDNGKCVRITYQKQLKTSAQAQPVDLTPEEALSLLKLNAEGDWKTLRSAFQWSNGDLTAEIDSDAKDLIISSKAYSDAEKAFAKANAAAATKGL
ncbi:MAG: hypothetical protein AB7I98_03910 [Verrucomicrobiales bacterium]